MTGKSVLIFGVNGFVGGHLAREFKEHGYEVFGSDLHDTAVSPHVDAYASADLIEAGAVAKACAEFEPTFLVNLAAISSVGLSWRDPQTTMQVNVVGALNVLDAARAMVEPPKVLLIGSSEEYAPSDAPLKETDPVDATNPYGISKMAQERFAEAYEHRYGLRIYRTRSFNHTGVGQPTTFVLSSWCKQVAGIERSGKPGVLKVGNINVRRDFSDVRDVVRAYRMLIESEHSGEEFNVGSGRALALRELAELVASFCSQDVAIEVDSALLRPTDNPSICCDASKARELLGWRPRYGIEATLQWLYGSFAHEGGGQ